jgi:ABC-type uncharacterized transport system substrate-binding protein
LICRFYTAIRTVLIAAFLLSFSCAYAGTLNLTLVLSESGGAYLEYSKALDAQLKGSDVKLRVIGVGTPLPESDLVIAAGMNAALSLARARPAAMLAVLVPAEGYRKLQNEFVSPANNAAGMLSAIYLDQPFRRQFELIATVLPDTKSVGVLYSTPPRELSSLRVLAKARNLELKERSTASANSLHAALQEILLGSDVLLALPDAEIYNTSTIRNVLLATYRSKVPLVGFSAAYVKAGALCAVYSTPAQIAAQSAAIIREFSVSRLLPSAQYAKDFEVSVNEQVARSLGLNIKSAIQVRSEMGVAP